MHEDSNIHTRLIVPYSRITSPNAWACREVSFSVMRWRITLRRTGMTGYERLSTPFMPRSHPTLTKPWLRCSGHRCRRKTGSASAAKYGGPRLPAPQGSGPGYRRPIVVIQSDQFNESRISTVVIAVITSIYDWAAAPGNILLDRRESGLPRDSALNLSQLLTVDKSFLTERVGILSARTIAAMDAGLKLGYGPVRLLTR